MSVLFEYCVQKGIRDYTAKILELPGFNLKGRKFDHNEIYHDASELREFKRRIEDKEKKVGSYLEFIAEKCDAQCQKVVKTSKGNNERSPINALKIYFIETYKAMPFLPLLAGVVDPIVSEQMVSIISKYERDEKHAKSLAEILTKPSQKFAAQREKEELYKTAASLQRKGLGEKFMHEDGKNILGLLEKDPTLYETLKNHVQQFGWIETRHFRGDFWALDTVIDRIRNVLNEDCSERYTSVSSDWLKSEKKVIDTYTRYGFLDEDKRRIETIRRLIFLRTQRKDLMNEAFYYMQGILSGVAKPANLEPRDLIYLIPDEILEICKDPKNGQTYKQMINERKKGFVLIMYDRDIRLFAEEEILDTSKVYTSQVQVNGIAIYPGEVNGLVRMIRGKEEAISSKLGEIVVTPMTSLDHLAIFNRIAGIITDEGGITCHAAQISREYKIPCITGTGNATQVFKTGDNIYLNANEGYARKIKS